MARLEQWLTAVSEARRDEQTLSYLKACGIGGMELSVSAAEYEQIDWADFRKNADRAGMQVLSYHLPFAWEINIAAPDEAMRQRAVDIHCDLMRKAAAVGIRRFVVHPSAEPIPEEERAAWMRAACRSLRQMADCADGLNSVVCVENLPRTCLGNTADEMLALCAADSRLRVCFDVNHLLDAYGCTHREFVEKLGDKIVTAHMSDYDFVDEKHFFPGNGLIDWQEIVELLEGVGYEGPFLYEGGFGPSHWDPSVPYGTYEEARERHLGIRAFRGRNA